MRERERTDNTERKNFKDAENFMLASFALDDTLKSDQALEMAPRLFDHWKLAHT